MTACNSYVDGFEWVVSELAREFVGIADYDVVAAVVVEVWARYRRSGVRRWTALHVADTARTQLRVSIALRKPGSELTGALR
jgi:hypothetical protein